MEQLQPTLERNPRVKRIVDENLEVLRQGRAKEVAEKIRHAVMSGSNGELERYIKDLSKRSQQVASRNLSTWLNRLPDGSQILPQLLKLKEAAETRSSEADRLTRDTLGDISRILENRSRQAEDLVRSGATDQQRPSTAWI